MPDSEKQIGFRGTVAYREKLQRAALDRGLKVQGLIELAMESYLEGSRKSDGTTRQPEQKIHTMPATPPEQECHKLVTLIFRHAPPDKVKALRDIVEIIAGALEPSSEGDSRETTGAGSGPAQGDHPKAGHGGRKRRAH